jgi:hypothetical protein
MCVPGGSGFAEFQKASDNQASSRAGKMILTRRQNRDRAAGGAGDGEADMVSVSVFDRRLSR